MKTGHPVREGDPMKRPQPSSEAYGVRTTYDPTLTARWRESFAIFWDGLPKQVQMPSPGKRMHKQWLLRAAIRLAALARPDGWLVGRSGTAYSEEQLARGLGYVLNTARGLLRWFASTGWLEVEPTHSRRVADLRMLTIPADAKVAWPGWPLGSDEGHRLSSTGDQQTDEVDGHRGPVDGHRGPVDGHRGPLVGYRSSSTGDQPPGNPDTRIARKDVLNDNGRRGPRRRAWEREPHGEGELPPEEDDEEAGRVNYTAYLKASKARRQPADLEVPW